MDCGVNAVARHECYMLKDTVWRSINPLVVGYLCFRCAEDRLGRPLHRGDFSKARLNPMFAARCALAERLQRVRPRSGGGTTTLSASAIRARLTKKKQTQSMLGGLSAELLPYRGRNGRVPRGTLTRVLRLLVSEIASVEIPRIPQSNRGDGSIGRRKRVNRRR